MKINLNIRNFKNIQVDEKSINWRIKRIFDALTRPSANQTVYEKAPNSASNAGQIALFLQDLGINVGEKAVQNIIKKSVFETEKELFVHNLHEGLSMFVDSNKVIHQNNLTLLYQILTNSNQQRKNDSVYRQENNHNPYRQNYAPVTVIDHEEINGMLDQFVYFVNQPLDNDVEAFAKMQIVLLQMLLISPFTQHNFLISKLVSAWYWKLKSQHGPDLPVSDYLETLQANESELQRRIQFSLQNGDYTTFIGYVADELLKIITSKMLVREIANYLIVKKKRFLANHEKSFLFVVLHYKIYEFDWKMFSQTSNWKFSKQYIMTVLGGLETKYDLLTSTKVKNRKFFKKSRFLNYLIGEFAPTNQIENSS